MIKSFKSKSLESFYFEGIIKGSNVQHHTEKLTRILDRLRNASDIKDMRYPGADLHKLEPRDEERWAVKVNKSRRITFIFKDGNAYEVDYIDYH